MRMAAIVFNDVELFEQFDNTPSIKGMMWNLMKLGQAISEKGRFKDYDFLYMYVAQGQGHVTPRDKILIVTKQVCFFDHTL